MIDSISTSLLLASVAEQRSLSLTWLQTSEKRFSYDVAHLLVHVLGEPGELVGKIVIGDPTREFDGYVNRKASEKKTARDVFRKGDMAFLTGKYFVLGGFIVDGDSRLNMI